MPEPTSAEPRWARVLLILAALGWLGLFLVLPLASVFHEALREGFSVAWAALGEPEARAALRLSLAACAAAVAFNTALGLAAAWLFGKFEFRGKGLLLTVLDLPFAVSPVVAGLLLVLLFGARGWFGPWLARQDLRVVFATPGVLLATTFVTLPFVARELIPVMQAQGREAEEAALMLGASGWQTFRRVTLPSVKWGLLYGVILCSARAMGEFGAVSVVSGHICGETNTLPLHVEALYDEYRFAAAFACASLLCFLALGTLALKAWVGRRQGGPRSQEVLP